MKDLQFGLTGVYGRRPIDVSLPVVSEEGAVPPSRIRKVLSRKQPRKRSRIVVQQKCRRRQTVGDR